MQPSDEELVRACQRNDETAWEQLIGRYERLIYTVPRRAGLDEDTAADVFQRVFATLLEHIDRIEQPARISAWLVTTARRETWRSISRERGTVASLSLDRDSAGEHSDIPDDAPLPADALLRIEEQTLVRAAVASLNERCRGLLSLLFFDTNEPSYTEIAARLAIREGSIGPTRSRCLQKLLLALDEVGWS